MKSYSGHVGHLIPKENTFGTYEQNNASQRRALTRLVQLLEHIKEPVSQIDWTRPDFSSRILVLHGTKGVGKTHLLHAFYNALWRIYDGQSRNLGGCSYYALSFDDKAWEERYDGRPIVLIDDLFKEWPGNIQDAPAEMWQRFRDLVDFIYESPHILIVTSNYSFTTDLRAGLEPYDPVGRTASRLDYLVAELKITGRDYRKLLQRDRKGIDDYWTL